MHLTRARGFVGTGLTHIHHENLLNVTTLKANHVPTTDQSLWEREQHSKQNQAVLRIQWVV